MILGLNKYSQTAGDAELKEKMKAAIDSLSAEYKEVIVLCIMQGMSHEEAAEILKCTRVAVATRLSRARKQLLAIMQKKDGDE